MQLGGTWSEKKYGNAAAHLGRLTAVIARERQPCETAASRCMTGRPSPGTKMQPHIS